MSVVDSVNQRLLRKLEKLIIKAEKTTDSREAAKLNKEIEQTKEKLQPIFKMSK